ncbi:MAG: hypothetical protein CBB72_018370 [Muricauda sp. TMED12]|nr:MAG: hypothetical protein CBB72_018370 [Muricauda sp. TMED12]|tara:strand:- start:218 stop:403 length:186 start_codon:yes stop_codon:yes gene_type:complete
MEGKTKVRVKPQKKGFMQKERKGFEGYIDGYYGDGSMGVQAIVISDKKIYRFDLDDLEIIE